MPFPSPSSIEKFKGWISTKALCKLIDINFDYYTEIKIE